MGITNEPKKISDQCLLFSIILFIIDKLVKGINWAIYVA